MTIPTSAGGQTIVNINTVKIKFPVPANSAFVSATLTGGSNIGSGTPTVAMSGGVITMTVPGPPAAGSVATLPTVTVNLTATGAPGSTVKTILAGSSYSNPGITFNVKISLFSLTVATNCFVNPSPVFSSTPIS
jgi:dehydratase